MIPPGTARKERLETKDVPFERVAVRSTRTLPLDNTRREVQVARSRVWWLTVAVVVEIKKLVVPLRDDAQCVFKESDDDEEAANCW